MVVYSTVETIESELVLTMQTRRERTLRPMITVEAAADATMNRSVRIRTAFVVRCCCCSATMQTMTNRSTVDIIAAEFADPKTNLNLALLQPTTTTIDDRVPYHTVVCRRRYFANVTVAVVEFESMTLDARCLC